jgi:tetratricopeptide (TPR) repeat protein
MSGEIDAQIDDLWDFGDPAASETRFRAALADPGVSAETAAELKTQLARSMGLQRRFDDAAAELDTIEPQLPRLGQRAAVRYWLERGRVLNSSGNTGSARLPFETAWDLARAAGLDGLAVDAAHMVAIVADGPEAIRWNETALAYAEASSDPRARRWRASLLNNLGWSRHDAGEFEAALRLFREALEARRAAGAKGSLSTERWCIARALRSLGRYEEALTDQETLAAELPAEEPDGFVEEERGELLLAMGRPADARPHLSAAAQLLAMDPWIASDQPARIERLRQLSGLADNPPN